MTRHYGKICSKHPELLGLRLNSNSRCVECKRQGVKRYMRNKFLTDPEWRRRYLDRIALSRRRVGKSAFYMASRRAAIAQRTPPWADMGKIEEVYAEAKELRMTVDHIVPLRGELVSGLHVHYNLRVIPQPENDSKGNKLIEELIK